jgi:hypothetical protein
MRRGRTWTETSSWRTGSRSMLNHFGDLWPITWVYQTLQ